MLRYLLFEKFCGFSSNTRTTAQQSDLHWTLDVLHQARNKICAVEIGREFRAIGCFAGNIDANTIRQNQEIFQRGHVGWVFMCNIGIVGIEPALLHEFTALDPFFKIGERTVPVETYNLDAENISIFEFCGCTIRHVSLLFLSRPEVSLSLGRSRCPCL